MSCFLEGEEKMGNEPVARGSGLERRVTASGACTWLRRPDLDGRWEDWFIGPPELLGELLNVPGLHTLREGSLICHRSHLPLLHPVEVDTGKFCYRWPHEGSAAVHLTVPQDTDYRIRSAGIVPRLYQYQGARFLHDRRGALLADQQRLGKTLQVAMSYEQGEGPLVVTGPLNVRPVWVRLFKQLWPDLNMVVLDGRNYDKDRLASADLVYVHHDILPAWQTFGWKRIGLFVIDEAHMLSNSRTMRAQAAQLLALRADRRVAVSGTPLWNKPAGLYNLLTCITPAAWGKWSAFAGRYASGRKTMYGFQTGEPSFTDEFRARMTEVMIRRVWEDVRSQLPDTKRFIHAIELSPVQMRHITFLVNALRSTEVDSTMVGTLAQLRRTLGQIKLEYMFDMITPWLGTPFVIWCWHKEVAGQIEVELQKRGLRTYKVTGQTSMYKSKKTGEIKREAILDKWREDPEGILICNIAVGQVGIDLSHASRAIFIELDFTPATLAQAEFRTFSPERAQEVVYMAAQHPVDQQIVEALCKKFTHSDLLGVPAADAAIDILSSAFGMEDEGNLERLKNAILSEEE